MSDNEAEIRRELESVEAYHARIRDHLRRIEAERDRLLAKLKDGDGQGCRGSSEGVGARPGAS